MDGHVLSHSAAGMGAIQHYSPLTRRHKKDDCCQINIVIKGGSQIPDLPLEVLHWSSLDSRFIGLPYFLLLTSLRKPELFAEAAHDDTRFRETHAQYMATW